VSSSRTRRPARFHIDRRADQVAGALAGGDPEEGFSTRETANLLGVYHTAFYLFRAMVPDWL
jgi:hypothetical protein